MSTETTYVEIPFGENTKDIATLLLAAAEKLELGPEVVLTTSDGFRVPEEVADLAGEDWEAALDAADESLTVESDEAAEAAAEEIEAAVNEDEKSEETTGEAEEAAPAEEPKAPAKKAPAKKSTPKKSEA